MQGKSNVHDSIMVLESNPKSNESSIRSPAEYHEKKVNEVVKIPILEKAPNVTFLEAYNCDSSWTPKPKYADRAKKQIYRTDTS